MSHGQLTLNTLGMLRSHEITQSRRTPQAFKRAAMKFTAEKEALLKIQSMTGSLNLRLPSMNIICKIEN